MQHDQRCLWNARVRTFICGAVGDAVQQEHGCVCNRMCQQQRPQRAAHKADRAEQHLLPQLGALLLCLSLLLLCADRRQRLLRLARSWHFICWRAIRICCIGLHPTAPPPPLEAGGRLLLLLLLSGMQTCMMLGPQSNGWAFCTQPCHRWAAAAAHRAVGSNAYDEEAMVRCQSLPSRS
jgi:hypothetical protein